MIEIPAASPQAQAAGLVGIVLLEAIVLYVGFAGLERIAKPIVDELTSP